MAAGAACVWGAPDRQAGWLAASGEHSRGGGEMGERRKQARD